MRLGLAASVVALVAVTALIVWACSPSSPEPSGVPPEQFGVPSAAPTAAPTATPTPLVFTPEQEALYGPRVELPGGLLLKQIGKVAQNGGPNDTDLNTWAIRLVLDSIEVDPPCGPYIAKPERGHRLVLSLRVETSAYYDPTRDPGSRPPHYYEWSTIGPDGVTEGPVSSQYCRSGKELPNELRPSAKYRGEVTVETANPAGQLVLWNHFVWNYPTS